MLTAENLRNMLRCPVLLKPENTECAYSKERRTYSCLLLPKSELSEMLCCCHIFPHTNSSSEKSHILLIYSLCRLYSNWTIHITSVKTFDELLSKWTFFPATDLHGVRYQLHEVGKRVLNMKPWTKKSFCEV